MVRSSALLLSSALGACANTVAPAADGDRALHTLTRASLDLRGVRPTDEEIAALRADPEQLATLLDAYVADDRFPDRLVDLYNELYLTRSEGSAINTSSLGISYKYPFLQTVGQEPLRLIAEIAREDLPYTAIATANWTMANETLAAYYPVDYPAGGTGWKKVHYTDGRPAAGVMSTDGLWWRYTTTKSNASRGRANTVAKLLLCSDLLDRDVELDPSVFLAGDDAVADALQTNDACANCHVVLDPLAGNFGGFYLSNYTSAQEALIYHPAREQVWKDLSGIAPGYYGTPTEGLVALGPLIAKDPRLVTCAVEQAWTGLVRRAPTLADQTRLNAVRAAFLDGGLTLRSLYRAVAEERAYEASDAEGGLSAKVASVELLASEVEDLTGFHWTIEDQDMLRSDNVGLHLIGGGVDGLSQVAAPTEASVGLVMVQDALAEVAASHVVEQEASMAPSDRRLFRELDPDVNAGPEALRVQLVALHRRLYGTVLDPNSEDIDAGLALWQTLENMSQSPESAWQGVLTAMLRDPQLVIY